MAYREEYRGHLIAVDTWKVGEGYRWGYRIDGGNFRDSRDRPVGNERLMLAEGLGEAKVEIDRMADASKRHA